MHGKLLLGVPQPVISLVQNSRRLALILTLGLIAPAAPAAWQDQSAGSPALQNFSLKESGADGMKWIVLPDKLGRIFVGGEQLQVFDGQAWRSFPVPNSYSLRSLAFGDDGRLWAGSFNEVGYFDETTLGVFTYRSLIPQLPKAERLVGEVWGCAAVGKSTYFICRDRLLRWDGSAFHVEHYAGAARLTPLKLGAETWFHHPESGLYQLTEAGPRLEIPATDLPAIGLMGLARDATGLLLVNKHGFFRPGHPPVRQSDDELARYLTANSMASFSPLADGNYALGTVNGGIVIAGPTGAMLRVLDTNDGLPTQTIFGIVVDAQGYAWCATPQGVFCFEANGRSTHFGLQNGFKNQMVTALANGPGRLHVLTQEGVYGPVPSALRGGQLERLPINVQIFNNLTPYRDGLLLPRFLGLDYFDGIRLRTVYASPPGGAVFFVQPFRSDPSSIYISENLTLQKLTVQPDGTFKPSEISALPAAGRSLREDTSGRLWLGTDSAGAFTYDPASRQLSLVRDPATGEPLTGKVSVTSNDRKILLLRDTGALQVRPDGTGLTRLDGLPSVKFIHTQPVPGEEAFIAAFRASNEFTSHQGLAVLDVAADNRVGWRELDVPALGTIGFVRHLAFTQENGRKILWVGGAEGLLRLDYEALSAVQPPDTPIIRLDTSLSSAPAKTDEPAFAFVGHRIDLRLFSGEYSRSKDWLFQTRMGTGRGEWSAPSPRRAFEYTNLSEGAFQFEARAVNSAGQVGASASFAFRVLPPWYRSNWAYAAYAASLALGGFGFIRIRERRVRERNQELEKLVVSRTEELLKANAAKDEFLANISHEIRNPMNGVVGIAETFDTAGLGDDRRHKFDVLRQCASHLSSLLEDILDFSRAQADVVELEAKPFKLAELVGSIATITAAESERRGIPVEIALSPGVPPWLVGDPRRIRQILLNFVGNALKFAGRGQICVTVWRKGDPSARPEVIFAVSDDGPGIPAEEQTKLFTRFERGAAALAGHVPGTGLGLALSRALAEKMGGRIWLESEPGQGSTFFFSAPFAAAEAPLPAAAVDDDPGHAPKFALVVDDEEYNRIALTSLLENLGCRVFAAANADEALALAGRQEFDFIFLDFALPGRSGPEIARALRTLPGRSAHAVIFATTAFNTPEKRRQCLAAGMNAFLTKPVTMERLRQALAATDSTSPPPPAIPDPAEAGDPLANLRLLARRKRVAFAAELALFLTELETEEDRLAAALRQEDAGEAGHYAHLLCGRCGFIREQPLEQILRKIEADTATGRWDEARLLGRELHTQLSALRVRLSADTADGPSA